MGYEDVVMVTIFLKDSDDYATANQVYARYFDMAPPARQAVEIGRIPGNADIEISVIAMKGST